MACAPDSIKSDKKKQKKVNQNQLRSFFGFIKLNEYEAKLHRKDIAESLGRWGLQNVLKSEAIKEKFDLLESQIVVVTWHIQQSKSLV